jgi:hypothetical protein
MALRSTHARTLGPRGPFLQSGVEVVSQLAHRRAPASAPRVSCCLPLQLGAEGASQCRPAAAAAGARAAPASARRVDGVPSESVQSTEPPYGPALKASPSPPPQCL